jgi:fumarate reductase subunit C
MKRDDLMLADLGLDEVRGKSRVPALLDISLSISGLLLALFMFGHLIFVSSILLGEHAMYTVTRLFEGYFLFGRAYPWLVSMAVFVVICLFFAHAALALRKFPASYRQFRIMRVHAAVLGHADTRLWLVQVYTGFAMFFLGSAHLFGMLVDPDEIGPYASADRVWGGTWPVDLLLLLAVAAHLGIGLYRSAVKWGWPEGGDATVSRKWLKRAGLVITLVFLSLGLLSLAAYMKTGYEHRERAGERYRPTTMQLAPDASEWRIS